MTEGRRSRMTLNQSDLFPLLGERRRPGEFSANNGRQRALPSREGAPLPPALPESRKKKRQRRILQLGARNYSHCCSRGGTRALATGRPGAALARGRGARVEGGRSLWPVPLGACPWGEPGGGGRKQATQPL